MSNARKLADNLPSEGQLGNRNLIINGAMQVAQRGTITGIGASNATVYTACDRFNIYSANSAGRVTASQEAITDLEGFSSALKIQCTTADTSVAANELFILGQRLEGQNVQGIQKGFSTAKEVTVSFYAKANETRVHVLEYYDTDNARQCSKAFTVTSSWQRFSLTFPADTTGKHDNDNNNSINFMWHLHSGSDLTSGTLNSSSFASATSANRAVGIGSIVASTNNNFFITGVQVEVGSQSTPFEHEPVGVTLKKCQRYYWNTNGFNNRYVTAIKHSSNWYCSFSAPTTMRANPTPTATGGSTNSFRVWDGDGAAGQSGNPTSISAAASGAILVVDNASIGSNGEGGLMSFGDGTNADRIFVALDAEL